MAGENFSTTVLMPLSLDLFYNLKRTLALHCGNGFDVGFSLYQSTRLSRYNPVS